MLFKHVDDYLMIDKKSTEEAKFSESSLVIIPPLSKGTIHVLQNKQQLTVNNLHWINI